MEVFMPRSFARLMLIATLLLCTVGLSRAATVPSGFVDSTVPGLDRLSQPTAFAFTPDERLLITLKRGQLLVYQNGGLLDEPALNLSERLCDNSERGLLGVAVDPLFTDNGFIYLYYTFDKHNNCGTNVRETDPVNRVSRFTMVGNTASTEVVLVDNISSPNGNHNAGDLAFGKDGYLYISTGDGGRDYDDSGGGGAGSNDAARDKHTLLGKILRITRDGDIPADNPFADDEPNVRRCAATGVTTAGQHCQETFAWGLRNPFRIAMDPNASDTRFFINDVGQSQREEVNEGAPGADYGWNCREGTRINNSRGTCDPTPPDMVDPIFEYSHGDNGPDSPFNGCYSITAGAFVPNGIWPEEYDGAYLVADYGCGVVAALVREGNEYEARSFMSGLGGNSVVHMAFGPFGDTQALYYSTFESDDIRRLSYSGVPNAAPTALIVATPTFGDAPLTVSFDGSGSSDPEESVLSYEWNFGDGATSNEASPEHTYRNPGIYTTTLIVRDDRNIASDPATQRIDVGNTPPEPQIESPAAGTSFVVGQRFTLSGSASDAQEGSIPGERLQWEVRQHHDQHFHPYLSATGSSVELIAPNPEDLAAVNTSYLEIRLTAVDAQGRTSTITRELRPQIVTLTFNTAPAGLEVIVDGGTSGNTVIGPAAVRSWPGYRLSLDVPQDQQLAGELMQFCHWAHSQNAANSIITPGTDTAYTAVFVPQSEACPTLDLEEVYLPIIAP
jgi:glucose/arabinose dehydrogenase